jgi:RNA polymerase sigma factor (sigma-70 family)
MNTSNWQDSEWLSRFRVEKTREKAFRELIQYFQPRIYAQVYRMCPNHEACDDIVQETFIKAWNSLNNFRGEAKLSSWLYRIAHNESINHLSKNKHHQSTSGDFTELIASSGFTEDEGIELEKKLLQAIEQLPPKQKAIFCYRYFDDMPYSEMSELMGVSEGSLKASYHHAAQKIESLLTNH